MTSNRILTTHVGSLPRSTAVTDVVFAAERGEPVAIEAFDEVISPAVHDIVSRQIASGIDIVSDGEMSKISYATYIKDRLSGFEGDSPRTPPRDLEDFPNFLSRQAKGGGTPTYKRPVCVGPIEVKDDTRMRHDLAIFRDAVDANQPNGAFLTAASPGVIALFQPNDYYDSQTAYLEALGQAMASEYEAIVEAGFILQLDCPDLALGRNMMYKDKTDAEFLAMAHLHVDVMNDALKNIPKDKIRVHTCWGNYEGPHHYDIPVDMLFPVVSRLNVGFWSFESCNPRHAHEWELFEEANLPDDLVLIPGMLDSTSNFVEHPRGIAQRLLKFADIVGADRVIAGTDCGFSTFAGFGAVDPDIVWAKFKALAQGAAIASDQIWGKSAAA
jgi:5-methyltetrahydropteroyltriglutamate--homocysteine methyltransferase